VLFGHPTGDIAQQWSAILGALRRLAEACRPVSSEPAVGR